uniref:Uncharacterized protein n=1 Tax=Arundo donax TaxID=35708 RepID=A0A0A9EZY6_ARUDO
MPSPPLPPCPPPPLRPLLKIFPRPIPPLHPNPVALRVPDVCTVTLPALLKLMTVPCTRPKHQYLQHSISQADEKFP